MKPLVVSPDLKQKLLNIKLMVHVCCAPDAAYIFRELSGSGSITCFFYNPNIYPSGEYEKRRNDTETVCALYNIPMLTGEYDFTQWEDAVLGLENEPEGGKRCERCYEYRLAKSADMALNKNLDGFTTVLTISPHKNSVRINEIGAEISCRKNIMYMPSDFKKRDGFKKSVQLSKELKLYRQNYCGCKYSIPSSDDNE